MLRADTKYLPRPMITCCTGKLVGLNHALIRQLELCWLVFRPEVTMHEAMN
jgi:hypothetical protein